MLTLARLRLSFLSCLCFARKSTELQLFSHKIWKLLVLCWAASWHPGCKRLFCVSLKCVKFWQYHGVYLWNLLKQWTLQKVGKSRTFRTSDSLKSRGDIQLENFNNPRSKKSLQLTFFIYSEMLSTKPLNSFNSVIKSLCLFLSLCLSFCPCLPFFFL